MKKNTKTILVIFSSVLVFLPVFLVYAEDPAVYKLISGNIPFVTDVERSGGGLGNYLNAFFNLGVGIAIALAVLVFVYNGVLYMTSDIIGKKEDAKKAFWGVIGGVLLVLSAVLILATINPDLVGVSLEGTLGEIEPPAGGTGTPPPPPPPTPPDGEFGYESPAIAAQRSHASPELESLLQCMAARTPGNVGSISSISDCQILGNCPPRPGGLPPLPQKTWEECAAGGCQHRKGSHHYGGTSCIGKSYAVDFEDNENQIEIGSAARACNPRVAVGFETNHVHVSIGGSLGCGGGN